MALNFPLPSESPYFDPASGLKYIWNESIGAWETAIQPPAVISEEPPVIDIPGFLWWDSNADATDGGRLKVWYVSGGQGEWVDATPTPPPVTVNTSQNPPTDPLVGDLWFDSINGRLYIYYQDEDGNQWVDAAPVPDNSTRGNTFVSQGTTPPDNPEPDDLWFDTTSGNLFIYYNDIDSSQWVITQNISTQIEAVTSVLAASNSPLSVTGSGSTRTIGIKSATSSQLGVLRLANPSEALLGTANDVALTPATLKTAISTYVSGTSELATTAEATAGTDNTKAVTPAGLAAALSNATGYGVPCGTIITFAGQSAPTDYLKCDGAEVSRVTYKTLFNVIGTVYGPGNGKTTFNLPTLTHENAMIIHCIKA